MANHIEKIPGECGICYYCGEPFKECDTFIPGIGVIIGEVDVKKYLNYYWHRGCIIDYQRETTNCQQKDKTRKREKGKIGKKNGKD